MSDDFVRNISQDSSLTDDIPKWEPLNPSNISHTKDKVKRYEEIIDESEQQLTLAQIKELFDFSNDEKGTIKSDSGNRSIFRRPSGRGREQKIKDSLYSVSSKLRWYQDQIVQTIAQSNEVSNLIII